MLTVYKASAGSGKTFTLTYRYIKLLLSYKDESGRYRLRRKPKAAHRSILAVTFTNKATDEMKRRIIHELAVLGGMEPQWDRPSPYLSMLTAELGCAPEALAESARLALRDLLFDFNFFQVSTIDSFFQVILRTFAREAELTGNYEVDLESDSAMESGLRSLFDSLRSDTDSSENARIIDWITRYLLAELREGRGVGIFNRRSGSFGELMNFVKCTDTEEFKTHYDAMMQYLATPDLLDRFRKQLARAAETHRHITTEACRNALTIISARGYDSGKLKVTSALDTRLSDGALNGYDTAKTEGTTIAKILANPSEAYNKQLRTLLESSPDPELDAAIATALTHLSEGRNLRRLWAAITKQLYNLGMLQGVYKYIEAFRNRNNTFLLSDTNSILKEIIGEGDTPFVFERIGVWLNHFLIDEFQDTSRMQWEIMRPLVREGQAIDADSLIIGDEKQCIYRFRSSDPSLLQSRVMEDFGEKARIEGDTPQGNTNWRSAAHIVRFNNSLFSALSEALNISDVYANVEQTVAPRNLTHDGYVTIRRIEAQRAEEYIDEALTVMTESMRRQLKAGYKPKDICVLVRFRSHGEKVIARLLSLIASDPDFSGLRVISDDAMTLGQAPVVRTIISILRHINSISTARIETTECNIPEELTPERKRRMQQQAIERMINRFEYARSMGTPPSEALHQAILRADDDNFDIKDDISDMACFSIPSLVERVIARMFTEELDSQCMYLSAFQDAVSDYSVTGNSDLQSFLSWWDAKGRRSTVSAPEDESAIRVMTVHKSKGLEFACVHIPILNYNMVEFKGNEWFARVPIPYIDADVVPPLLSLKPSRFMTATPFAEQYLRRCREQLLDELNILYVALTRAAEELCISYMAPPRTSETFPVGGVLDDVIPSLPLLTDHESEYTYGEPTRPQPEETRKPTALDPTDIFFMPPYATADRDDLWANTRIDDLPDYSVARDRGIALHDVLSRVHRASQLSLAVARCAHAGLLPQEEAPEIEAYLSERLSRPEIAPWFDGFRRAVNERPIMLADGSRIRPDRVVWTADGHTDVIDYKFGEPRKSHLRQVAQYMDALRSMGYPNVRGFLWYVAADQITPV